MVIAARLIIEDNNNGIAASQINVQNGGRDLKIAAPVDIIFHKVKWWISNFIS